MSNTFNERLTELETFFNGLKTAGCPRDICGVPNVGVTITGIGYQGFGGNSVGYKTFVESGGIGDVTAIQFQSQTSSGAWLDTPEYSCNNTSNSMEAGVVSYKSDSSQYGYTYQRIKGRWKNSVGWGPWGDTYDGKKKRVVYN